MLYSELPAQTVTTWHLPTPLCRGDTPLDSCISKMQTHRDILESLAQPFPGHDAALMLIIDHFKAFYADPAQLSSLPIPRNKYGCTCGQDIADDGCAAWLSPRMRYRYDTLPSLLFLAYQNATVVHIVAVLLFSYGCAPVADCRMIV